MVHGFSSGDSDDDTLMAVSDNDRKKQQTNVARIWVCALIGACLLTGSCLLAALDLRFNSRLQPDSHREPMPSRLTVLQLLESDQLRLAVEDAVLRLAVIAQRFQLPGKGSTLNLRPRSVKRTRLSAGKTRQLRQEAATTLKSSVQELLQHNPQTWARLSNLSVTREQGGTALSMLRSFTDERLLDLSMQAMMAISRDGTTHRHSMRSSATMDRLQEEVQNNAEEIRYLREELIPSSLHGLSDEVKQQHIKILSKKGAFNLHGDIAGWKSDLEISQVRRLDKHQKSESESLSAQWPMTATLPTMDVSEHQFDSSPPIGIPPPPIGINPFTPLNFFTIGAPAVSNLLGLVFLTLSALLPGRGGFPRNDAAQAAMWGLQGALTLGECFSNFGLPKGVVYFASCIIDVLFFGFDVAWVFFEGLPHNFPKQNVKCADFSQWPVIENLVCGNCVALVPTAPYGGMCDRYCKSFGHRCVFAAEEVDDDCTALSRFGCDESITNTRDMLCQCQGPEPDSPRCAAYSNWPSIKDATCGDCTALVDVRPFGRSCQSYCESFEHVCVRAADDDDDDCRVDRTVSCNRPQSSSDLLCTCERAAGAVSAIDDPRCASYSEWPKIFEFVCGDCEARVPSNAVVDGTRYTTCQEYCEMFDHECQEAVDDTICGENSAARIGCDEPAEFRFQRCTCVLPGNGEPVGRATTTSTTTSTTITTSTTSTTTATTTTTTTTTTNVGLGVGPGISN